MRSGVWKIGMPGWARVQTGMDQDRPAPPREILYGNSRMELIPVDYWEARTVTMSVWDRVWIGGWGLGPRAVESFDDRL